MRNGEARAKKKTNFHDCQCEREESWADTGHWYVHRIDNPDLLESASPRELYDGYKKYLHAIVFEDYRRRTISYIPRWSQLSRLVVVLMKFQNPLYNTRTNFLCVHGDTFVNHCSYRRFGVYTVYIFTDTRFSLDIQTVTLPEKYPSAFPLDTDTWSDRGGRVRHGTWIHEWY